MSTEPIYDRLYAARMQHDDFVNRARKYLASSAEGNTEMDVVAAVEGIRQHLEAFAESAKEKLEQDLPAVAEFAQKAAANPVVAAIAAAVHLPAAPEVMDLIANDIAKWVAALGAAKAAGAAEALTPPPAPEAPAEPAPAEPEPLPAQ